MLLVEHQVSGLQKVPQKQFSTVYTFSTGLNKERKPVILKPEVVESSLLHVLVIVYSVCISVSVHFLFCIVFFNMDLAVQSELD